VGTKEKKEKKESAKKRKGDSGQWILDVFKTNSDQTSKAKDKIYSFVAGLKIKILSF